MAGEIDTKFYLSSEQLEYRDSIYFFGTENSLIGYRHKSETITLMKMGEEMKSETIIKATGVPHSGVFNVKDMVYNRIYKVKMTSVSCEFQSHNSLIQSSLKPVL